VVLGGVLVILLIALLIEIWVFKVSASLAGYRATWSGAVKQFIAVVIITVLIKLALSALGISMGMVLKHAFAG